MDKSAENNTAPKPAAPSGTRNIYMYRMVGDQKVRWRFEVDSQMVIVSEGAATNLTGAGKPAALVDSAGQRSDIEAYKRTLTDRGITFTVGDGGQILIGHVPQTEQDIILFLDVNNKHATFSYPGWDALRDVYFKEYAALGGSECPSCQLGGLQRKYREKLKTIIDQNNAN